MITSKELGKLSRYRATSFSQDEEFSGSMKLGLKCILDLLKPKSGSPAHLCPSYQTELEYAAIYSGNLHLGTKNKGE